MRTPMSVGAILFYLILCLFDVYALWLSTQVNLFLKSLLHDAILKYAHRLGPVYTSYKNSLILQSGAISNLNFRTLQWSSTLSIK
jgi:hypothetical protein